MEGGCRHIAITAGHDHSLPVTGSAVAHLTENIITLFAAIEKITGYIYWNFINIVPSSSTPSNRATSWRRLPRATVPSTGILIAMPSSKKWIFLLSIKPLLESSY
jgi:hypothetical protein